MMKEKKTTTATISLSPESRSTIDSIKYRYRITSIAMAIEKALAYMKENDKELKNL